MSDEDLFTLTVEEELKLDQELMDELEVAPEGWTHLSLAVPQSFLKLYEQTLTGYKAVAETDKTFPAFEAMVMEAFNSLPSDVRETIGDLK